MADEIARVARRLEEAKESKSLDLSSCKLNQVPDATYLMLKGIEVETVDLSGNHLKRILSKFCTKLPSLKEIHLHGNKLSALPEEFKSLEHLTVLDFSDNNFDAFPTCLYECPNLTKLVARNNKFTDIDVDQLRKMASLQDIDLQDNPLCSEVESKLKDIDLFTVHIGASDSKSKKLEEIE